MQIFIKFSPEVCYEPRSNFFSSLLFITVLFFFLFHSPPHISSFYFLFSFLGRFLLSLIFFNLSSAFVPRLLFLFSFSFFVFHSCSLPQHHFFSSLYSFIFLNSLLFFFTFFHHFLFLVHFSCYILIHYNSSWCASFLSFPFSSPIFHSSSPSFTNFLLTIILQFSHSFRLYLFRPPSVSLLVSFLFFPHLFFNLYFLLNLPCFPMIPYPIFLPLVSFLRLALRNICLFLSSMEMSKLPLGTSIIKFEGLVIRLSSK